MAKAGKLPWFMGALAFAFVACAIDNRSLHVTAGAVAGSPGTSPTSAGGGSSGTPSGSSGSGNNGSGAPGSSGAAGNTMGEAGTPDTGGTLLPAEACQADAECASDHCVDGVCCDGKCTGACVACNLPTSPGHCASVASGSPSPATHPACDKAASTTCGQDGLCDGAGVCHDYESGTACAGGSCDATSGKSVTGASCDGKGNCVPAVPVACTPFKCSGAACATMCAGDGDCVGQPCVNGSCGTVGNSNACKTDAQCTSTHCVDGFCCNSACTGSCQACDLSNHQGTCTTLTAAAKPHGTRTACVTGACSSSCDGTNPTCTFTAGAACGTCHSCSAAGVCGPVGDGTADAACPASSASCAAGGCNASGTCQAATSGTQCADYTCANSATGIGQYAIVTRSDKTCNGSLGAASCKAAANVGCAGLVCADSADCKTGCTADIDCANSNYCKAGVCTPWMPNGNACTGNSQCASRICSGGRCAECDQQTDCLPGFSCDSVSLTCVCESCPQVCTYGGDCSSARAPGCNAQGACDCFGTPSCPVGTICYRANQMGIGQCLVPVGMPCHAASDCAGPQASCVNGVCAPNAGNCARNSDCSGAICCTAFGNGVPNCTSSCG
jgi:hypothetical protein